MRPMHELAMLLGVAMSMAIPASGVARLSGAIDKRQCRPVRISSPECRGLNYDHTDIDYQRRNVGKLSAFNPVMNVNCNKYIHLFVCAMHLPMCHESTQLLARPCKRLCQRVHADCTPFLSEFGFYWPPILSCDSLADDRMCIDPEAQSNFNEKHSTTIKPRSTTNKQHSTSKKQQSSVSQQPARPSEASAGRVMAGFGEAVSGEVMKSPDSRCSEAEVPQLTPSGGTSCAELCHANLLFSDRDKSFADSWMLIWSGICFTATSLAVATVGLDSGRLQFPERPIAWVAMSHLFHSVAHLLRVGLGPEVAACSTVSNVSNGREEQVLFRIGRYAGGWCSVIFLLLYFSWLASCAWWVMLTLSWHLCAARKWAPEALQRKAVWMHLCAWGLPLLASVMLLVLHRVRADELTHLCVLDYADKYNTLMFDILPTSALLLLGICFLISALCSTISVRHALKWSRNAMGVQGLEKLMTKISLFSFLFVLPAGCVLAASTYDYLLRDSWSASVRDVLAEKSCANASGLLQYSAQSVAAECRLQHAPSSAMFTMRMFMSLAAGLPSGLMIWFNCKTAKAWRRCLCEIVLRRKLQSKAAAAAASAGGVTQHMLPSRSLHLGGSGQQLSLANSRYSASAADAANAARAAGAELKI